MRRIALGIVVVLGLVGSNVSAAPEARPTPKRVIALAKACETRLGVSAEVFRRHVTREDRAGAGWRIVVRGPDAKVRLAYAEQIAEAAGATVHRVRPSAVVGKYVGETEKNLRALLDKAESKEWILFFDEADALFGKRSDVKDAHDRYAHAEAATIPTLLLEHDELVVLGTIDDHEPDPLGDVVVTAKKPAKPGPVPPLAWTDLCWSPAP